MRLKDTVIKILRTPVNGLFRILDRAVGWLLALGLVRRTYSRISRLGLLQKTTHLVAVVFVLSLLARVAMFLAFPSFYPRQASQLEADSYFYDQSALNGMDNGHFSTFWSPGFSMFLASIYTLFGHSSVAPALVLIVLGSAVSVVMFLVSMKIFNSRKTAFLAALIIAIEPTLVREAPMILTDTLSLFVFSLVIYFVASDLLKPRLWYSGALGGLLAFLVLTRPQYEILIPLYLLFLVALFVRSKKIKVKDVVLKVAVFIVILGLVLGPWMAYTNDTLGRPVIVTNGGVNFYMGNNENATGRAMGVPLDTADELWANSEGYRRGFEFIKQNPLDALVLDLKKIVLMVFAPQRMPGEWTYNPPPFWTSLIYGLATNIGFILVEIVGFLGLVSAYRRRLPTVVPFVVIALAFYAIPVVYVVEDRYLISIVPILALFGAEYLRTTMKGILLPSTRTASS